MENKAKFVKGDEVQLRNDSTKIGIIVEVGPYHGGLWYYRVNFGGGNSSNLPEIDLISYEAKRVPHDFLKTGELGSYSEFQRNILYHKLSKTTILSNNIYSFNSSKTIFYPYQFKPLLKFLESSNNRILIADEVGLGKSIEAGLIYTEMKARGTLDRVLIVCPSGLVPKWQGEMENRFGESFEALRSSQFIDFLEKYSTYGPMSRRTRLQAVISIESLRQANIIAKLEDVMPAIDLIIIDEAHYMRNAGTKQNKVGNLLSETAEGMVMLSATPIQMGTDDLCNLLRILDADTFPTPAIFNDILTNNGPVIQAQNGLSQVPADFDMAISSLTQAKRYLEGADKPYYLELCRDAIDRLYVLKSKKTTDGVYHRLFIEAQRKLSDLNFLGHILNRTRKREAHENIVVRDPHAYGVEFLPQEWDFYNAVLAYVKEAAKRNSSSKVIQHWLISLPLRRIASSISAMVDFYKRKLSSTEDVSDLGEDDDMFDESDTEPVDSAREKLLKIINHWDYKIDSKFCALRNIIDEIRSDDRQHGKSTKIMIFAFFKDTLRYLERSLRSMGIKTVLITGDVDRTERNLYIKQFEEDGSIEILLSSRVGTEGLDFQFCDSMVNYDLPWNPMEIEQRIGRLDRIGQKSKKIRIYNLYIKNTIEEKIVKRLFERLNVFKCSIGDLEPILGQIIHELTKELMMGDLSPAEEEALIESKTKVIENRRQELENLEKNTAKFIGVDSYFLDEVARIKHAKRFVTNAQLKNFIYSFIRFNFNKTKVEYDGQLERGRIICDHSLLQLFAEFGKQDEMAAFYSAGGCNLTFDAQVAFNDRSVEFINNTHPFVQIAIKFYNQKMIKFNMAYHVRLKTDMIPAGRYLYFIYRLTIVAAKSRSILLPVFINENGVEACTDEAAEILLSEMLESGADVDAAGFSMPAETINRVCDQGEKIFLSYRQNLREEAELNNNRLVEGRIASINMTYSRKISRLEETVVASRASGKDKHASLMESQVRKAQAEMSEKVKSEELKRVVSDEYNEIAAGVLEVIE